ncbi:TcfC E-set like domain-containing protein [Tsuneonella troitsensis]|uniref:TcfC E-set like domain-containing protein n=1 Tax=Tsuneonella troitsensis TaxID=292222 RepID=UPI0007092017|nr:TcfC E-set like domain-containing protein [Tsuneonella troitsensis]
MIAVGEPDGFSDLTRDHELMVDVYFGGIRRGEAIVRVSPDQVTFAEPAAVVSILPSLADASAVLQTISLPLPANGDLACTPSSDRLRCGRLAPNDVGVIFSRDRFRLDIFLNPRFVRIEDRIEERYLPVPARQLSLVNSIGGFVSGQSEGGERYVNIQNQLVVARGEQRLRADFSFQDGNGISVDRMVAEWDKPERRYSAGLFWTAGNSLVGSTRIVGLGIESQIDTRRDREQLFGSPVIVYLDRRARVDALYDGRVVSSKIYEAGSQQIDTSGLPEGSYELTLRIDEPGDLIREERRFYSKNRRIPSLGRSDFYLFGGVNAGSHRDAIAVASDGFLLQGGYARRLSQGLALDGQVSLGDPFQSAEVGVTILSGIAQARAAILASSDGRLGSLVRVNSTGSGPFNYSFDLRALSAAESNTVGASNPFIQGVPSGLGETSRVTGRGYTQAGGLVSFTRGNFRLLGTMFLRDEAKGELKYAVGPAIEWDAARMGTAVLTLRSDFTATESGTAGFAGVALRFTGRRGGITALGGIRKSSIEDDQRGSGAAGSVSGGWSGDVLGGELAAGAGYEHSPNEESALASLEFTHPFASVAGDLSRTEREGNASTQYTVGLQTTFVAGGGAPARPIGKSTTGSVIVAQIAGAREGDRFDILVNDHVSGYVNGPRPAYLRLEAYRAYNVRVRPVGADLVSYDRSPREIGLYPGSVTQLRWVAAPVVIKFGQLMDLSGAPIARATITGRGVWTQTDDAGYFQLEVPEGVTLEVMTSTGARYALELPEESSTDKSVVRLGAVICCEDQIDGTSQQLSQLVNTPKGKGN